MSKQDDAPSGPSEEMKAKFREALDKKHAHGGKDVSDDHARSKVDGAHGPANPSDRKGWRVSRKSAP